MVYVRPPTLAYYVEQLAYKDGSVVLWRAGPFSEWQEAKRVEEERWKDSAYDRMKHYTRIRTRG